MATTAKSWTVEELDQQILTDPDFAKMSPDKQLQFAEEVYRSAGYTGQASTEPPPPQYGLRPKPKVEANAIDTFLKQAAIPTATAAGGTILGTAVGGPLGGIIGESVGSGAGEYLNQKLGITPESKLAIGLSTALPPVMRGVAWGLQRLPKLLPGVSAALQGQAAAEARALPKAIGVPAPSGPLYEAARTAAGQNQAKMPFAKTRNAVHKLLSEETGALAGLQDEAIISRLTKMDETLSAGGLTFSEFDKTVRNLGRKIASTSDDSLRGTYKMLFKNLMEDAETMRPPVGVPLDLWKQARQSYRKEMARTEFAGMIESQGIKKVGEFLDQVNPNAIGNWMKSPKQEFWRKSLEPGELAKIDTALKEWASIPTVPVKRGQPIGSGRRLGMIGAGGAVGGAMGGGTGAAIGMLAADHGADLIAQALTTDRGRKVLMKILRASGGRFGQDQAGLLGAFLAGGFGDQMVMNDTPTQEGATRAVTLPSYQSGTAYVPETGQAKLHKGEMVIPKEQADAIRMAGEMFPALTKYAPTVENESLPNRPDVAGRYDQDSKSVLINNAATLKMDSRQMAGLIALERSRGFMQQPEGQPFVNQFGTLSPKQYDYWNKFYLPPSVDAPSDRQERDRILRSTILSRLLVGDSLPKDAPMLTPQQKVAADKMHRFAKGMTLPPPYKSFRSP